VIEANKLVKAYLGKRAVDIDHLQLQNGRVYAMLGPNGSGKTTFMKMAAGLVKPTSGSIYVDGAPVSVSTRSMVAYMPTEGYFYQWMTLSDAGKYYQDFFEDFSYLDYERMLIDLELDVKMKVKTLSSGMTAKSKVAITLARNAQIHMLDEPFNGIDLLARDQIKNLVMQAAGRDKLLLLSSHMVEEMEDIANSAIYMKDGKAVDCVDLKTMRRETGLSMADKYRQIYGAAHQEVAL
jgi:ABC-2 type transport system ATP-binding protein